MDKDFIFILIFALSISPLEKKTEKEKQLADGSYKLTKKLMKVQFLPQQQILSNILCALSRCLLLPSARLLVQSVCFCHRKAERPKKKIKERERKREKK
jgi:hypothetical protein